MLENDTFEIEKARAVIGITPRRQKRTEKKIDIAIEEFGEAKVEEYRDTLALVCFLEVGPHEQKKRQKPRVPWQSQ